MPSPWSPGIAGMARCVIPALAVLSGIVPFGAHASPDEGEYRVAAEVVSSCAIGSQLPPLYLTTTVDKNGKLDPALVNKSLKYERLVCTGPSQISLLATSLRLTTPEKTLPPGKSQTINFIATASGWTAENATVTTLDASPVGTLELFEGTPQVQLDARAATIHIHFSGFTVVSEKDPGGHGAPAKPIDGNYAATIRVSLRPVI